MHGNCRESILMNSFEKNGYAIFDANKKFMATKFINLFSEYRDKFTDNAAVNRNIIRLFANEPLVRSFFNDDYLIELIRKLGIKHPIFCGPVVTHFTSNDLTGSGFGLPYHQDYPSMGGSKNSIIVWTSLYDTDESTHGISVVPKSHLNGLLPGEQTNAGYLVSEKVSTQATQLKIKAGEILVMSSFLVHSTFVNPNTEKEKLSLSARFDDFNDEKWEKRGFITAYSTSVDRNVYLK